MRFMLCSLRAPSRGDKRGAPSQTQLARIGEQAECSGQHHERQEKVGLQIKLHGTRKFCCLKLEELKSGDAGDLPSRFVEQKTAGN
jgi:hypothetical protein